MDRPDFFRINLYTGRLVIGGDHKRKAFFEVYPHLNEITDPEIGITANGCDSLGVSNSEPRDAN